MELVIGWVRLKPGKRREFMALVPAFVRATRALGDGVAICEVTESLDEPDSVLMVFGYRTSAVHAAQIASVHDAALFEVLDRLAIEGRFENFIADGSRLDVVEFPRGPA